MNWNPTRLPSLPAVLAGTAAAAAVIVVQPAVAQTARDVARIAVPTTVRIDNLLSPANGGSGVIIARKGKVYTVLTANHVVENPNAEYQISTSKNGTHPVLSVQSLQTTPDAPDLAIVTFESKTKQAIAPLADSNEASIGSGVYISGFPQAADDPSVREYEFTSGQVTSRPSRRPKGYTMRYDAVTRRGMSGGPVFDVSGRVVGIHGQGDRDAVVRNEAAGSDGTTEIKTGFNAAVPVNTFLQLASQSGINISKVKIDDEPPENVDAERVSRQEVRSWEQEFAKGAGLMILRELIRLPFRLF